VYLGVYVSVELMIVPLIGAGVITGMSNNIVSADKVASRTYCYGGIGD
jgi:hypothetical protein